MEGGQTLGSTSQSGEIGDLKIILLHLGDGIGPFASRNQENPSIARDWRVLAFKSPHLAALTVYGGEGPKRVSSPPLQTRCSVTASAGRAELVLTF